MEDLRAAQSGAYTAYSWHDLIATHPTDPETAAAQTDFAREDLACLIYTSGRSDEHTSELPSLMRNPYAAVCLTKQSPCRHAQRLHNRTPPLLPTTRRERPVARNTTPIHPPQSNPDRTHIS